MQQRAKGGFISYYDSITVLYRLYGVYIHNLFRTELLGPRG